MRLTHILVGFLALLLAACGGEKPGSLVVYSGRSKSLVDPIIAQFSERTGIPVEVRYGETAQLTVALAEEGDRTAADVFWAQDAGALGSLADRLSQIPDTLLDRVPPSFRNSSGLWIATSGRARVLAYSPERADTASLPRSIFDLSGPDYAYRVGWAPTNGSFQVHVTALRTLVGDDSTRSWLEAMKSNGAKSYQNNTAIVQAIADGEIDYGLPNHYYLYRFKSEDPNFPVAQTFFAEGDPGNLISVAGAGVLATSRQQDRAFQLLSFLLSQEAQRYFATETFEYPVVGAVETAVDLPEMDRLEEIAPDVDLESLQDLEGTL
ncbi:MAG: iron ABC transporter substrate-binding protein, partial [Rhodothermales bacterium]